MLKKARQLIRKRRVAARREDAKGKLGALQACSLKEARAICEAVEETLYGTLLPEEEKIVSRIEERRRELLASTEILNVIDYGAGSSEDTRSESEMAEGIPATISVGTACTASKDSFWALLLFKLIRKLGPQCGVELGTCVGISAAYQSAAQKLNGGGRLVSLEGSPETAAVAEATLKGLEIESASVVVGPFHETYERVMREGAPVDYLFIDGHHDRDATIEYYQQARPHLADHGVLVFDDISWNEGMQEAWRTITEDQQLIYSLDLGAVGVAVYSEQGGEKHRFALPL